MIIISYLAFADLRVTSRQLLFCLSIADLITALFNSIGVLIGPSGVIEIFFFLIFPFFGLSIIYFLREYLFKKKENKGIKEIFESTSSPTKRLPGYKIPSQ